MQVDVARERGRLVALPAPAQHLPHVGGPARPSRPEPCSSASRHLVDVVAALLHEPQQQARVDAARAGGHHEALDRRESHRRVDRPTAADGGQRRAGAEVAGDEPQAGRGPAQQLGRASRGVGVGEPVEAEAPQAVALAPLGRQRVGRGGGRQPGVERGVEARHRRQRAGSAAVTAASASSAAGWCSGASGVSARSSLDHPAVQAHRPA